MTVRDSEGIVMTDRIGKEPYTWIMKRGTENKNNAMV
jgi:hypothetical protein